MRLQNMVYSVSEYDFTKIKDTPIAMRKQGNQGNKSKRHYKDIVCAFDIETSAVPFSEQSIMYIWQFQAGLNDTIVGRTWEEFNMLCERLCACLEEEQYLVIYVHNLSYEFQFLSGIYNFETEDVFAVKKRKVLKCTMLHHLEFRCSYLLTNSNLENFTKNMKVEHIKRPGEDIDYKKYRTPQTPLTEKEMQYCLNDVIGLVEAITKKMKYDNDNLYSIPMTSTGYVRRDTKRAMRWVNHNYVKKQLGDYDIYTLLREAFRGGNTHANRFYVGRILDNVKSADRSSSYPDVQINCDFPVDEFKPVKNTNETNIIDLMYNKHRPLLFRVIFEEIELTDRYWGFPYLTVDKGRNIIEALKDNGRILYAKHYETTLTDIDFKIVLNEYNWKHIKFMNVYCSRYGKLPPTYKHNIINYYKDKTTLKGVEGRDYDYMRAKALLNSIYGMSAQDPIKQNILFRCYDIIEPFHEGDEDVHELYIKYMKKAFLPYQWGVWTTALARYRLEEGLYIAGENAVYCDTDSVKYIDDNNNISFKQYNDARIKDSIANKAYATDPKGETHYMGVFEQENSYSSFKTLGAKKYAYTYGDGKTHITIAGVDKKLGGTELDEEGQKVGKTGLEMMKDGFIFDKAGGQTSLYNDEVPTDDEYIYTNNVPYHVTRNVTIKGDTYRMGMTDEYSCLLFLCEKERLRDLW